MSVNKIKGTMFKRNSDVISRKIVGEMLLVPIKGRLAEMNRVFALEPVGEFIRERLDGEKTWKTSARISRRHSKWEAKRPTRISGSSSSNFSTKNWLRR